MNFYFSLAPKKHFYIFYMFMDFFKEYFWNFFWINSSNGPYVWVMWSDCNICFFVWSNGNFFNFTNFFKYCQLKGFFHHFFFFSFWIFYYKFFMVHIIFYFYWSILLTIINKYNDFLRKLNIMHSLQIYCNPSTSVSESVMFHCVLLSLFAKIESTQPSTLV